MDIVNFLEKMADTTHYNSSKVATPLSDDLALIIKKNDIESLKMILNRHEMLPNESHVAQVHLDKTTIK